MAKLVNIWRDDEPVKLACKQMPLIIDESLTMIMDISNLGAVSDSPLVRGKQLDEFTRKLDMLTKEEIKASFEVTCKDILAILGQAEPCVGCRRSVERLFYDLMKSGHPALDPLVITPNGLLSIKDDVLESPQRLCTILHGHSARLHNLVEKQPRNRKSRRCVLHSLEIQRMRPPPNAWREVWDCMELPCQQELTLIETDTLDDTLETYLRKHRFCAECRNKVLLASSLLTREPEPTKEKGYVAVLYSGIKRCIADHHVHLPTITEYISTLIGRAQPELMGRERHAKTLEIAQEEVLTCLGICIAERLHRVHRRLKEEETVCKVLAAVAVDALSRNFQMAVEVKQGISQLELLYEEITREEIAKQQRREKLRLKRKKKKERRYETEEKENSCDCSNERQGKSSCSCAESKPTTQNIDRHKLQVLDPKNKGPPTCKCPDCLKKQKTPSISQSQSKVELAFPVKKTTSAQKAIKSGTSEAKTKFSTSQSKQSDTSLKQLPQEDSSDTCESCKEVEKIDEDQWHAYDKDCKDSVTTNKMLLNAWITKPSKARYTVDKTRYTMWIEMKKRLEMSQKKSHSSSEHSSQDCGYSSGHNISSSSLPSTPEGSEVACNDECCNHEGACHDKLNHSSPSISLLQEGGLTLSQMLKDSNFSDDDEKESYIPAEEVLEFKSRMCQLTEKRQELRQTLRERFAMLCNHQKPLTIFH
ncbi:gametogenetin-binding protein 2-like isoform X1 [Formica exsecta]|uniref:gametogenetin-binding protein 2-like isoform X1 n=2 Tax=Formica exsecta TaxID=72781 RepID=UPI0011436B22|nr:gametogenetin-binding protein 2-like isoform X1 [Formica exsecta]